MHLVDRLFKPCMRVTVIWDCLVSATVPLQHSNCNAEQFRVYRPEPFDFVSEIDGPSLTHFEIDLTAFLDFFI